MSAQEKQVSFFEKSFLYAFGMNFQIFSKIFC